MRIKKILPWWIRIVAKILLSRLPFGYKFWKRLGLFEHGDMSNPIRAFDNYMNYADVAGFAGRDSLSNGGVVLELGPGDSVFTAMIGRSFGAKKIWLVDSGSFATRNLDAYKKMSSHLISMGFPCVSEESLESFGEVLSACRAEYLTEGISSLSVIPSLSVDFCFSNAVLEHVAKSDFFLMAEELYRVLKPNGVSVHRIDLRDHLGGGLNNLRFSDRTWEGRIFRGSGFYTNRLRFSEISRIFSDVGFSVEVSRKVMWPCLPIGRDALNVVFRDFSDEDLRISGFDVVLRKS